MKATYFFVRNVIAAAIAPTFSLTLVWIATLGSFPLIPMVQSTVCLGIACFLAVFVAAVSAFYIADGQLDPPVAKPKPIVVVPRPMPRVVGYIHIPTPPTPVRCYACNRNGHHTPLYTHTNGFDYCPICIGHAEYADALNSY